MNLKRIFFAKLQLYGQNLNLEKKKEIFAFIFDDNNFYIFIKDKNKFEGNLFKDDAKYRNCKPN